MATVEIHVATLVLCKVTSDGKVYTSSSDWTKAIDRELLSIQQRCNFTEEFRLEADTTVPNTVGNPNLKTYLEAEAASGFQFAAVNQSMVITQKIIP